MIERRRARLIILCALTLIATSATPSIGRAQDASIEAASRTYQDTRDYRSLAILTETLAKGTPRSEIERLLGEPDYSPTDGQFYYASDTKVVMDTDMPRFTLVLVVNYVDDAGEVTPELQSFFLGPVGE